jgi:Sulfotransferase family
MDPSSLAPHILNRAIVFEDLKVFYVPVPKASCTAILWALAKLSGLDEDTFLGSFGREVSRSLTIHDMNAWPDNFRFGKLSVERQQEVMAEDGWLRFTAVRHPFRRLWSAWQSKILLGEPQFTEKFSDEPWYPDTVRSSGDVFKMFREFVQQLAETPELVRADVHWAPQVELIDHKKVSYDHIGRVEKLGESIDLLRDHVRNINGVELPELGRENVTPIPYIDQLFEESDVEILGKAYADDLREFDYDPPKKEALTGPVPSEWMAAVDVVAPALSELRLRNERVGDLQVLFRDKRVELNSRISFMRDKVQNQKARIQDQAQRNAQARQRNEQLARLRKEQQERNERLVNRVRTAENNLEKMRNSLSWRVTKPLRTVTGKLRGGRRKGGPA